MLRISSWNVNSLKMRLDRLLRFLEREQPDVVCLQELKGTDDKFPFTEIQAAGYCAEVYGQKTYNGVALLSKTPLERTQRGLPSFSDDASARFISAHTRGVDILCGYFPNGQEVGSEKYWYKLQWMQKLLQHLSSAHSPEVPLVLAGDFNVAPTDLDVHDPQLWQGKVLCSAAEREAFRRLEAWGLRDTFRKHCPAGGQYSWWDYRDLGFPKNQGLRIDFVLATAPLWEKCQSAQIHRDERKGDKPSDHAPVSADFAV